MRRDWFCPCLLFWGGMVWLGVSGYFAASAWIRRTDTFATFKQGSCTVAAQRTQFCVVDVKGKRENRCRLQLAVYLNVSEPGNPRRPTRSTTVVSVPGVNDGCVFANCGRVTDFFRENIDRKSGTIGCWQEYERPAKIRVVDPNGKAKRNSVLFSVLAAVALLLVLAMVVVMVQLACAAAKRDRE